jgi:ligand-binding sensor domain-containing protein/DNA-binding CsgD family transcriptional regulator
MKQSTKNIISQSHGYVRKLILYLSVVLLLFLINGIQNTLSAQIIKKGIPQMSHYARHSYNAGRQNWQITQDEQGYMYFANNSGLLQFDGNFRRLIPVNNKSIVRSVNIDSLGTIYVGAANEIGRLKPDKKGELQYESLNHKIPKQHRNFKEVWRIFITERGVYFFSFTHAMLYRDGEIEVIIANEDMLFSFQVGNDIYIQDKNKGLLRYNGFEFKQIKGGAQFTANTEIWTMFPFDKNTILIGTDKHGLYKLKKDSISYWDVPANEFLEKNQIFSGTPVNSNSFAFGTIQNGLVIIDDKGQIQTHLNKDKGLENNTVLSMFIDRDSTLWLGLDNGISAVQIHSPLSLYSESMGIYGAGYTSYSTNDYLYFGTNQGLFARKKNSGGDFSKIQGAEGQVWKLKEIDGKLLCAHTKGAFIINREKAESIYKRTGTWTFLDLKKQENLVLCGNYEGLALFEKTPESFRFIKQVKAFNETSRSLLEDSEGNIWMAHGYKGIYKIQLNAACDSVISYKLYTAADGFPSNFGNELFTFRGSWGVATEKGIFSYDKQSDRFTNNYKYNDLFFGLPVYQAKEDRNSNIWLFQNNRLSYIRKNEDGSNELCNTTIGKYNEKLIPAFEDISFTDNNNLLIAYDNGFIRFENREQPDTLSKLDLYIRKVITTNMTTDSVIYVGDAKNKANKTHILKARNNALTFFFSVPYYKDLQNIVYSYKVSELHPKWAQWQETPFKEFNNIPPGEYTFSVRAKNLSGQVSESKSFRFKILPPWYATNTAYSLYIIAGSFIIFILLKVILRKIRKDKQMLIERQKQELQRQEERYKHEKLQQEQELIRLRNEKLRSQVAEQKKEAEVRNLELTSVTMQITHKNEIMTNIKDKIEKVAENVNRDARKELRKLTRTIEGDIRLDEDWERFKSHFELVHEGFFKRLQNQYDELTPKDLKMCAYLRMNLSTKEISPLLNISVRSVENARYRLRKKFDLPTDVNLVDFIMKI